MHAEELTGVELQLNYNLHITLGSVFTLANSICMTQAKIWPKIFSILFNLHVTETSY